MINLMKRNILWAAGAAVLLFAACSNRETPFLPDAEEGPTGQLSTAELLLSVTIDDDVRTRAVDTDGFIVDVLKHSYTYSALPEVITLPEGDDYSVEVKSDVQAKDADWDAPYYVGSQNFAIEANKVTQVEKVVCKRDNVRVSVTFDDDLKAHMSDDSGVKVDGGVGYRVSLFFDKNESRHGYFAHGDGWTTLAAHFVGTIDGDKYEITKTYENVKPGDHFHIIYDYRSPENPAVTGGAEMKLFEINTRVEHIDSEGKVTVIVEVISDDGRPSDGNEGNPDDPKPDDPVAEGPTIEAVAPINLDAVNEVDGSSVVKLEIKSKTGITGFIVDIKSNVLTPEELQVVGLASHLDLVNPGELEEGLTGLGFPVGAEVANSTELTFDISGFMELLGFISDSGAQHDFVLKVTDANGTTEKTLKLKMK